MPFNTIFHISSQGKGLSQVLFEQAFFRTTLVETDSITIVNREVYKHLKKKTKNESGKGQVN